MHDLLENVRFLRPLDVQAARLLQRYCPGAPPELPVIAALASWATGQGHTCLPLSALPGLLTEAGRDGALMADCGAIRRLLLATPVVGRPGEVRPLILDSHDRLYLLRFFRYEEAIAAALRQRTQGFEAMTAAAARPLLDQFFPPDASGPVSVDWQRTAAALALIKRFVVISGGPGTGKTYTVARLLALLIALSPRKPRIALAAPTGKAALRLRQSIRGAKTSLPPSLAEALPDQAQTLHRLLGVQTGRPGFVHHRSNPLHLDLLLLDEASMIDVPLMAALLAALPPSCRVILLGDRDQLASVEAGNLFGDICGGGVAWSATLCARLRDLTGSDYQARAAHLPGDTMADALVLLRTSRRFQANSGIGALSRAVNTGTGEQFLALLHRDFPDLHFEEQADAAPGPWLKTQIERFFSPLFAAATPQQALEELGCRRILCALREGASGVEGINSLAQSLFRRKGLIPAGERCYRGMPIIIMRNDYGLNLFNGDTGILWPDDRGVIQAWFPGEDGAIRQIAPARLPAWQTSYAITVHKSQGSEFREVLLLLPHEDVPILSRELLYTGMTRARERLLLSGRKELLLLAMERRLVRYSGLADQLRRTDAENPPLSP
jgi:exodeoxyribonuclease V alpha subunit